MRVFYQIVFALSAICMIWVITKIIKSNHPYVKHLGLVLGFGVIAIISNILMSTRNYDMVMLGCSGFYASMDFITMCFLEFALSYTGQLRKRKFPRRVLFFMICFADAVSILSNPLFHHVFTLSELWVDGDLYFSAVRSQFYTVHLVICYLFVAGIAASLIYQAIVTPRGFKRKYITILSSFGVAVAIDAVYLLSESPMSLGVLTYAIVSMIVYYYADIFEPFEVMNRTINLMVKDLAEGILIYDAYDNCLYINDRGKKFFGVDDYFGNANIALEDFRRRFPEKKNESVTINKKITKDGLDSYYNISYQQILGRNGEYNGCVVRVMDQTEEVLKSREEHFKATHDLLTGIYNKERFFQVGRRLLEAYPEEKFVLVCSDIDNFKLINDVFGMNTGDTILRQIAYEISIRVSDMDQYCRLEGDKFAILMPASKFKEEYFIRETDLKVDISVLSNLPLNIYIGVYEIQDKNEDFQVMCDRALMAIKSIKGNMERKIAYYDSDLREKMFQEKTIEAELEPALENKEFVIYLQPQVNDRGKVLGAESLVRWNHPERGLLAPGAFIEFFEQRGLISRLDQYVWEESCKTLAEWKQMGREDLYLSVNISARDLYLLDIFEVMTGLTRKYNISPKNLHLEITETAAMFNVDQLIELIGRLRQYGFEVEMDDFGSGYSSLNMLKNIDIDVLKVDMAFLGRSKDENKGRKILDAVVQMANNIKIDTIIEGVETKEEMDFLLGIGCKKFQGYYFDKPMAISSFESKYMSDDIVFTE